MRNAPPDSDGTPYKNEDFRGESPSPDRQVTPRSAQPAVRLGIPSDGGHRFASVSAGCRRRISHGVVALIRPKLPRYAPITMNAQPDRQILTPTPGARVVVRDAE